MGCLRMMKSKLFSTETKKEKRNAKLEYQRVKRDMEIERLMVAVEKELID